MRALSGHSISGRPYPFGTNWWLLFLRGVSAIAFGVLAVVFPGLTIGTLVLLFGAYVLIDGVLAIAAAAMSDIAGSRLWLMIVGLTGVLAGIATFLWPAITALTLLFFIAAWSIVIGVVQIIGAIQLRHALRNEWLLALSGAISVMFGVALLIIPGVGALALVGLIAAYAITFGVISIAFALRLRRSGQGPAMFDLRGGPD